MGSRQCKILFLPSKVGELFFSFAKVSYLGFQTAFLRKRRKKSLSNHKMCPWRPVFRHYLGFFSTKESNLHSRTPSLKVILLLDSSLNVAMLKETFTKQE